MAGTQSATLQGWAIKLQVGPYDHTYVVSSCGLTWGCRGRSTGGSPLSSGTGDSSIADCLSQPNSEAGIKYLRTGVCHQIANRILHPAGQITVMGCTGYSKSAFLYGPYGKGKWPELLKCYPPGGGIVLGNTATQGSQGVNMAGKSAYSQTKYNEAVAKARTATDDEELLRLADLAALVEAGLGHRLDQPTFNALAKIQAELWHEHSELDGRFESGDLSPDAYQEALDAAIQRSMGRNANLLGEARFIAIFGEEGRNPASLGDRDTFLADSRRR
jgi:hypothetical protein